jgi:hypothetical protein
MDWATDCFARNHCGGHRVFYATPLAESLALYAPFVPADTLHTWTERLRTPIVNSEGGSNNWDTYLMKGEWLRARLGLIDRDAAVARVEALWRGEQRARLADTPLNLYHDLTTSPDTLAVEAVGRVNLLALVADGYDGPSRESVRAAAEAGTATALRLQAPDGQAPCNGRTDDHVWVDVGYQLGFELLAERLWADQDAWRAGQTRRAALLAFVGMDRWRRDDGQWAGSYSVTKNHFDPAQRVGYQTASQWSNYNGSLMHHLAQAWHARQSAIPEQPAPTEIGGYALTLDHRFSAAVANAGGMLVQFNLAGDTTGSFGRPEGWTALGVVRLVRAGWDGRLGPSDGRPGAAGDGVSFAPTFREAGRWLRLASLPARYAGRFSVEFTHPLLVRCAVDYAPRPGQRGPSFRNHFVITPDGVLATLERTAGDAPWGVTLPLLANDGRPLDARFDGAERLARTAYPGGGDEQCFLAADPTAIMSADPPVRTTYGDVLPVRLDAAGDRATVFVYPRGAADPSAAAVRDGLRLTPDGYTSPVARVAGTIYVGRWAAGGFGQQLALTEGGAPDLRFDAPCGFLARHDGGRITALETDRAAVATVRGRTLALQAFTPVSFDTSGTRGE